MVVGQIILIIVTLSALEFACGVLVGWFIRTGAGPEDTQGCQVPPIGWACTRQAGHDGPCAAVPAESVCER